MRPIRTAAAFAALLLASAVAAPSVGAFDVRVETGTTGFWTINDDGFSPGAVCRYENNPGKNKDETNKVSSRKIWTHGDYPQMTWVGHKVIFYKRANASSKWKIAKTSQITKKKANQASVAFFGAKHYRTPENHKKLYRVVHQLIWYKPGSKTKVDGKMRGAVEVHKHVLQGKAPYQLGTEGGPGGWCKKKFWPIP